MSGETRSPGTAPHIKHRITYNTRSVQLDTSELRQRFSILQYNASTSWLSWWLHRRKRQILTTLYTFRHVSRYSFPVYGPVDGEVANLLPTCCALVTDLLGLRGSYGETGVMDFDLNTGQTDGRTDRQTDKQ